MHLGQMSLGVSMQENFKIESCQIASFKDEHFCHQRRDLQIDLSMIKANQEWSAAQLKSIIKEEMFGNCIQRLNGRNQLLLVECLMQSMVNTSTYLIISWR